MGTLGKTGREPSCEAAGIWNFEVLARNKLDNNIYLQTNVQGLQKFST